MTASVTQDTDLSDSSWFTVCTFSLNVYHSKNVLKNTGKETDFFFPSRYRN